MYSEVILSPETQKTGQPHPEKLGDEIFLGYVLPAVIQYVEWETKRLGDNNFGESQLSNELPMFVKREEVQKAYTEALMSLTENRKTMGFSEKRRAKKMIQHLQFLLES